MRARATADRWQQVLAPRLPIEPLGMRLSMRLSGYIRLYFVVKGREREQYA